MIKSSFSEVILDTTKLKSIEVSDIQEVIREFPYFSAAHLLLAKKFKDEDNVLFEKQLNLTAAYVQSRKVLYNLIHTEKETIPDISLLEVDQPIEKVPIDLAQNIVVDELNDLIQSEFSAYKLTDSEYKEESKIELTPSPKIGQMENQKLNFTNWLDYFEGNEVKEFKTQQELIEEFIQRNPRIEIKKLEDAPIDNVAKPSAFELEEDMVTETLAKIHLDQGNRIKAIEIYDRLKLKYPEKSSYFAAQIEFIKQK